MELLKDHFMILTASQAVKMSNSSFLWDFNRIERLFLPNRTARATPTARYRTSTCTEKTIKYEQVIHLYFFL